MNSSGTGAFLNLRDSTGTLAQSGTFTILTGCMIFCLPHHSQNSDSFGINI